MLTRLQHFLQDRLSSLGQYWGTYIVALYTAIIRILYIYYEPSSPALSEMLLSCGIIFPLMMTSSLISQITGKQKIWDIVGHVIAFILGIGFYSYIHHIGVFNEDYSSIEQHHIFVVLSYVIARGSLLGGIAYSTYKTSLQTRGWLKELVINILIAVVSSLILRGGLSASIGSVDYLFDINVYYKRYQYIGVIAFCLVGVSVVLTNLTTIKKTDDYPKIFRFFGLYIFLPLAIIYAAILVTYGAKILITQTWPKGLISWMVMGYTIRCTIVYFLTYPLQTLNSIKKIHTGYFVSILVFLPLLVGAIYQRIDQYGITEPRYLLIMIALWIAIIGIGSLIWRSKSWLLMIAGLLILAINSTYTPWSASSVSLASQQSHLEKLLKQHDLFDGQKLTKQTTSTSSLTGQDYADMHQIGMISSYISQSHGVEALEYLYNGTTGFDSIKNKDRRNIYQPFLESVGYTGMFDQRSNTEDNTSDEIFFNIYYNKGNSFGPIDIQNYNSLIYINSDQKNPQTVGSYTINLEGKEKEKIIISQEGKENIYLNLYDYKDELYQLSLKTGAIPTLSFDGGLIIVDNLNGTIYKKNNTTSIGYYSLMVFVK